MHDVGLDHVGPVIELDVILWVQFVELCGELDQSVEINVVDAIFGNYSLFLFEFSLDVDFQVFDEDPDSNFLGFRKGSRSGSFQTFHRFPAPLHAVS